MTIPLLEAALGALLIALPVALCLYLQRLPVAPACPSCRAVTREVSRGWSSLQMVPALATTFLGECTRCGWRGRMRWRWATRTVRNNRR